MIDTHVIVRACESSVRGRVVEMFVLSAMTKLEMFRK